MELVTRRFLLGALPSTIVLATLPVLPALAATPGLTTHMLDTMNGIPAEGVRIDFSVLEADVYRLIATMRTNADGRTPVPLLNADTMKAGRYQLLFYVAEYFAKRGVALPDPPFVDRAVIQFGITTSVLSEASASRTRNREPSGETSNSSLNGPLTTRSRAATRSVASRASRAAMMLPSCE